MRWGKFILFFQAIVTLIIGIVFFMQVFNIEYNYEPVLEEVNAVGTPYEQEIYTELSRYEEFKERFFNASYIIVIVSLVEMIVIWRLFDA